MSCRDFWVVCGCVQPSMTPDGLNIETNFLEVCKSSHPPFQQSFRHVPAQGTPWQSAGVPCTTEDLQREKPLL